MNGKYFEGLILKDTIMITIYKYIPINNYYVNISNLIFLQTIILYRKFIALLGKNTM